MTRWALTIQVRTHFWKVAYVGTAKPENMCLPLPSFRTLSAFLERSDLLSAVQSNITVTEVWRPESSTILYKSNWHQSEEIRVCTLPEVYQLQRCVPKRHESEEANLMVKDLNGDLDSAFCCWSICTVWIWMVRYGNSAVLLNCYYSSRSHYCMSRTSQIVFQIDIGLSTPYFVYYFQRDRCSLSKDQTKAFFFTINYKLQKLSASVICQSKQPEPYKEDSWGCVILKHNISRRSNPPIQQYANPDLNWEATNEKLCCLRLASFAWFHQFIVYSHLTIILKTLNFVIRTDDLW